MADYRVLKELGRGGQGIVYLAEDLRHARKLVALKVLKDAGAISDEALERLRREVEAAARLHHPGICGVHEAVLDGHSPFIAMNYVEGQTLAQADREGAAAGRPDVGREAGAHGLDSKVDSNEVTTRSPAARRRATRSCTWCGSSRRRRARSTPRTRRR